MAFCVIVGDTIPQVMDHLFPALEDMPFLWLLTNRRAVMILLILGICTRCRSTATLQRQDFSSLQCKT